MASNLAEIQELAASNSFSGAVRILENGSVVDEFALGRADRNRDLPNRIDTRFGTASATKGFTALTVMSLIESGELALDTPVRTLLGDRLPLIDAAVTVEQLLAHTSGIGDYIDEAAGGDIDDFVLGGSAHELERPSDYLSLLTPHAMVATPGAAFAYNNSGYVVLSLLIELVTGSFHASVQERVLGPAGVTDGGFFRSDDPPANTALGYLQNGRTNVFHLPVIGGGDGGIYLTLDDVDRFWAALFAGNIVSTACVTKMTTGDRYGLGFWLANAGATVMLEGMDAGVSFKASVDRATGTSYTVMSNTSDGAWPLIRLLEQH